MEEAFGIYRCKSTWYQVGELNVSLKMNEAAHITLWCKREDSVFEFTAKVSIPKKIDDELWGCEWSLGKLLLHEGATLKNVGSMLTLSTAIRFVAVFLDGRSTMGDEFYFDEALTEPVGDIYELFGLCPANKDNTKQGET